MLGCFRDINTDTITLDQVPILLEHTHLELIPLTPLLGHLVRTHQVHTHPNQDTYHQDSVHLVNILPHQHLIHLIHLVRLLRVLDIHQIQVMFLHLHRC